MKKHKGVSLGYTALSGGGYARNGWSGSFHANQNILHDIDLQIDIVAVCYVIIKTFGHHQWYQKIMKHYDTEENMWRKRFLLPGTPCTGIWWSCDSRGYNEHIDFDAYGVAFVFSTGNYTGGDLTFRHKNIAEIQCSQHLKLGEVVAGRWSRSPHFIKRCKKGEERSVIVVYGDYRILKETTYLHVENDNTATLETIIDGLL